MDLFTDFLLSTGPADLGGPDDICNLLARRGYMLQFLLRGREGHKTVQGGSKMRGDVLIRDIGTARDYKPGEKQSWPDPQVLDNWEIPWRFTVDHMAWNDQQVELNASSRLKESVQFQEFISMRKKLTMRTVTSLAHTMEDQLWALPVWADMEQSSGKTPQSLLNFSNELPSGLYYSYTTTGGGNQEVQGLSKATYSLWDNARESYSTVGADAAGHLFRAFDNIMLDLGIKPIPGPQGAEMSEPESTPNICATNKVGFAQFQRSLRANQDWFRMGPQDPAYPGPNFNGVQLLYVEALDTAPVYPTAQVAALGAETAYGAYDNPANTTLNLTGNAGARYHFFDFTYTHKAVYQNRIFKRLPMKSPSNQVTDHVIPVDNWHNNMCRDPRRQGCVYPSITPTG